MDDYYELLIRAVAGMAHRPAEERARIYSRARDALFEQLRRMDPPVPDEKIFHEAAEFDEAVKRVEQEFRRALAGATDPRGILSNDRLTRDDLASVSSPSANIDDSGRLDAGPNTIYDAPVVNDQLIMLPIRQGALIKTILADLPSNSPKSLKAALEGYRDELVARGARPILGLLRDMNGIIAASIQSDDDDIWLSKGVRTAFELFTINHFQLIRYFPLDIVRQEIYARAQLVEENITHGGLTRPIEEVVETAKAAHAEGLITDDFSIVIQKLSEITKIVASLYERKPLRQSQIAAESAQPSAAARTKKDVVLTAFGFLERAYNLAGTTAGLAATPEGQALINAIGHAVQSFSPFVRL